MTAPCATPEAEASPAHEPHVAVVGGGLAGLTAACDLVDAGLRVTLLESRSRLGGATFSFPRDGITIDNGQHVLLRCCTAYRDLLERFGTSAGITLQDRFTVPVLGPGGRRTRITRSRAPAPLHLLPAIARYSVLSPMDRARVLRAASALRLLDPSDPDLDRTSFGEWLTRHGQNAATRAAVWDLLTIAALNADTAHVSLASAAMVFRTALLDASSTADIGIPRWPLTDLHVGPAEKYLLRRGAQIRTRSTVRAVVPLRRGFYVRIDNDVMAADAVVLATPPGSVGRICPEQAGVSADRLARLGAAPIVNVHVLYERAVTDLPFAAAVSSPVQWFFDRTDAAGVRDGQYLTVSVSAADPWFSMRTAALRDVFLGELGRLLPAAAGTRHTGFFVTRERRATFRQGPGSGALRPAAATRLPGLVLAGSWTATGWPDTMEGAVRSGHRAADAVATRLRGGVRS